MLFFFGSYFYRVQKHKVQYKYFNIWVRPETLLVRFILLGVF